jgi:hypothetical protein
MYHASGAGNDFFELTEKLSVTHQASEAWRQWSLHWLIEGFILQRSHSQCHVYSECYQCGWITKVAAKY